MGMSSQSIRSLYRLSLVEQEGIGTAYEYYAKLARMNPFLRQVGPIRKVLVAGLPERYGYSMDFIRLSEQLGADVIAVDERPERVKLARAVLAELVRKNVLNGTGTCLEVVRDLTEFQIGRGSDLFDIAISCEVVQRLESAKSRYFTALWKMARNLAIFVPNGTNKDHASHSGLRSILLEDLQTLCLAGRSDLRIVSSGYLDMPPFPPGITRSQEKRDKAASSRMEGFAMHALGGYCTIENLLPDFAKAKLAHIAYVMASRMDVNGCIHRI
jgi:hypothetical protein